MSTERLKAFHIHGSNVDGDDDDIRTYVRVDVVSSELALNAGRYQSP